MKRLLIIIFLFAPCGLFAEQLYFTYIGATAGAGYDKIEYKHWSPEKNILDTEDVSGSFMSGGLLLNVYAGFFIGEFSLQYILNSNSEIPVNHLLYDAIGKYSYQLKDYLAITAGAGLYMETPPSNRGYESGGGAILTHGVVYNLDRNWKIIFDLIGRYGSFGIGEDSTRLSYGAKLGIVYKIGRI